MPNCKKCYEYLDYRVIGNVCSECEKMEKQKNDK
jgi:hypothetical protein